MVPRELIERLMSIHSRVVGGDEVAREEIASLLVSLLSTRLRRLRPGVDGALVEECVHDAVLDYLRTPGRFDPSRSRLDTFVAVAARRNLIDRLRHEKRPNKYEVPLDTLEEYSLPVSLPVGVDDSPRRISRLARSESEVAYLKARLHGEQRAEALARVMGLGELSLQEQRRHVKRVRDRLKRRAQRLCCGR
jgi:RNA polymerase sigma-70 factor (ECF subfamily)